MLLYPNYDDAADALPPDLSDIEGDWLGFDLRVNDRLGSIVQLWEQRGRVWMRWQSDDGRAQTIFSLDWLCAYFELVRS